MGSLSKLKIILPVLLVLSSIAFGHGDEDHSEDIKNEGDTEMAASKTSKEDLELNALEYEKSVKPVFQKKCYDCHGSGNEKPWYYVVPGAKQLMNSDMAEAKEHMDMTKGFPFSGHGTPHDDLVSLRKTTKENTMPPKKYLIMHWGNSLSAEDKKIINKWIDNSLTKMNKGEGQ
mgnify:CR=1 FL=1